VRRYCAKLQYELELHAASDPARMPARYVELLRRATLIEPSRATTCATSTRLLLHSYLRAWAFEAQIRGALVERFGEDGQAPQAGERCASSGRRGSA